MPTETLLYKQPRTRAKRAPATPLAELRAARGLRLREVSAASGIHVATLSQLEHGLMVPQPQHLAGLAAAFGVPVESWRVRFILETEAVQPKEAASV